MFDEEYQRSRMTKVQTHKNKETCFCKRKYAYGGAFRDVKQSF